MSRASSTSSSPGKRVIIIGAGIYGLCAAKTYLQINPNVDLTIVDADSSVGGVWSASRVYAGLVADLPSPVYEFSDLRMSEEFGIPMWADIPGKLFHQYLEKYAAKFNLLERCQLNTYVLNAEREGMGWRLRTRTKGMEEEQSISCDVLMVATGNYSKPSMPDMDMSAFKGMIMHTKDLHKRTPELISEKVKTVVVVGGNKSALEAAEVCAMAGKTVHWTIRKGGIGPGMLMNAKDKNGKASVVPILCRFTGLAVHTMWRERGMWDRFFLSGNNAMGSKLFNWYWNKVTKSRVGDKYEKSENGKLLKPDVFNLFWSPSGISIAHKEDLKFLKLVDEGELVKVRRTGVKSLGANTVELGDGTTVQADAIIFATGWEMATNEIFSPELTAELGLPVPHSSLSPVERKYWEVLDGRADKEVLDIYPILAHPPKELSLRTHPDTPFRQFRTIVSPRLDAKNDRSIVFLGQLANTQHAFYAEISTLWTVAYLEGLLPDNNLIGNKEAMDQEIASMNAFMARRYPGRRNIPWAVIEIRDWMDLLLGELGLRTDRKRLQWERSPERGFGWFGWKGWTKEWFEPYEPQVYKGIVAEFLEKVNEMGGKDRKLQ